MVEYTSSRARLFAADSRCKSKAGQAGTAFTRPHGVWVGSSTQLNQPMCVLLPGGSRKGALEQPEEEVLELLPHRHRALRVPEARGVAEREVEPEDDAARHDDVPEPAHADPVHELHVLQEHEAQRQADDDHREAGVHQPGRSVRRDPVHRARHNVQPPGEQEPQHRKDRRCDNHRDHRPGQPLAESRQLRLGVVLGQERLLLRTRLQLLAGDDPHHHHGGDEAKSQERSDEATGDDPVQGCGRHFKLR